MIIIKYIWKRLLTTVMYVIAPPQCFSCKNFIATREILCSACENSIELIAPKIFPINKKYILTVFTLSRYTDPLRPMLFLKYYSDPSNIKPLARLLWKYSALQFLNIDYFVPIPLHWSRKLNRGFNQTELLAQELSTYQNKPVLSLIKRIRRTEYQVKMQHADRQTNVSDAFCLQSFPNLAGKHIMLVDDSCTTGSTAIAAAKTLLPLEPASINLIVICRAL